MTVPAVLFGAALLGLFFWLGRAALGIFGELAGSVTAIGDRVARALDDGEGTVRQEIRDLEDLVDRLPARWEDIKREAARLDARARYAVDRARQELAERGLADERLDDVGAQLRLLDGEGGELGGMQPVPTEMARAPEPPPAEPASWEDRARMRKFGGR